MHYWMIIVGW